MQRYKQTSCNLRCLVVVPHCMPASFVLQYLPASNCCCLQAKVPQGDDTTEIVARFGSKAADTTDPRLKVDTRQPTAALRKGSDTDDIFKPSIMSKVQKRSWWPSWAHAAHKLMAALVPKVIKINGKKMLPSKSIVLKLMVSPTCPKLAVQTGVRCHIYQ